MEQGKEPGLLRKIGAVLLKILTLFVIFEPIWMLLPFAGFLYGSVLHIQTLNQNPSTAWLTHFVFPVLTLGWTGPILVLIGLVLFCIGAGQIYWAKFRKTGLQTKGIYYFVRHPQYISLTLFGVGILLTWGRAITFLSFFTMMFLYYYLAKHEENVCIRIFGDAYKKYRERTSYIFPGDRFLRPLRDKLPANNMPAPLRIALTFLVTFGMCIGLMTFIQKAKLRMQSVPYLTATIQFDAPKIEAPTQETPQTKMTAGTANGMPFVQSGRITVMRGPYRNAFVSGFAERVMQRLPKSKTLAGYLAFLDQPGDDVLFVWCAPYEQPAKPGGAAPATKGSKGPPPVPHGPDRVRLILMRCSLLNGATIEDALMNKSKRKIVKGCIAKVNIALPEDQDFVESDGKTRGPGFPGEARWDFFLEQFAANEAVVNRTNAVITPGKFTQARLVLAKAPILRTRIDAAFAQEILDRLTSSTTFRDRAGKSGAGGDVVLVAFPRPGPNWYSEHHGRPQISLFVMLVKLNGGAETPLHEVFHDDSRKLLSAFTVPMDFMIAPPADSIGEVTMIGPRRDLEERWRFFLSGVGSGSMPHKH